MEDTENLNMFPNQGDRDDSFFQGQMEVINGRAWYRPATVSLEDLKLPCLRSTREIYFYGPKNRIAPCGVNEGFDANNIDAMYDCVNDVNNGIKRKECNHCWNDETHGTMSMRQKGNIGWSIPRHGNSHTEFTLSNECPAACIYCNSTYSSTWKQQILNSKAKVPEELLTRNPLDIPDVASKQSIDIFKNVVKYIGEHPEKLACVGLNGGEPLLWLEKDDNLYDILTTFFDANQMWNRSFRYDIITSLNVSTEECKKLIAYCNSYKKKFPSFFPVFQVSFESTGPLFNYVRYGNSWDTFHKNLCLILSETDYIVEIKAMFNNVMTPGMTDFINYVNMLSKTYRPIMVSQSIASARPLGFNYLDESFYQFIDNALSYIEKNKMYLTNVGSMKAREGLIGTLQYIKDIINTDTDKNRKIEAIEFFNWLKEERGQDLKEVNVHLYDFLHKNI